MVWALFVTMGFYSSLLFTFHKPCNLLRVDGLFFEIVEQSQLSIPFSFFTCVSQSNTVVVLFYTRLDLCYGWSICDNLVHFFVCFNSAIAKGGGVSLARNLLSHTVNVRPKLWDDKYPPAKIWIGRIKSYQLAQCTADAVFYYTGGYPFHFRDANWNFPPLHCMGRYGQPEVLSSREMCLEYVEYIAKSLAFRPHRFDFINQVKAVLASPAYLHQRAEFLESLNEAHGAPAAPVDQLADTANQPPPENDDANYHDWREMEVECNFMMSSEIPPSSEAKYIASFGFDFDNKLQSTWEIPYVPWNAHDKKMEDPSTSSAFADSFVPPPSEGKQFE